MTVDLFGKSMSINIATKTYVRGGKSDLLGSDRRSRGSRYRPLDNATLADDERNLMVS